MLPQPQNPMLAMHLLHDLAGWQHYTNRQAVPVADQRKMTAELLLRCEEQGVPVPPWLARLDEGIRAERTQTGMQHHYAHAHQDPENRPALYEHILNDPKGPAQYAQHLQAMADSDGRFGDSDPFAGTGAGWEQTDADLERWESKLRKALRAGKPLAQVPFSTTAIAPSLQEQVIRGLPAVTSAGDLKRLFARVQDTPLRARKR